VRLYFKKSLTKIGLVVWLKVKALRSSPSTRKTETKKYQTSCNCFKRGREGVEGER
jgi:hypothetical protein